MNFLSLTILVIAPLIFALVIAGPWFPNNEVKIRRTAKAFATIQFVYSLFFVLFFNPSKPGYQFVEYLEFFKQYKWLEPLGASFTLAVDGISLVLVVLTTFLILLASVASKSNIHRKHKLYYSLLLVLEAAILGVFCAKDLLLFFIFWEIELIPMYLLISIWGSGRKEYSAMKFILYTFFGSIFMLASILAIYHYHFINTGTLTFDLEVLTAAKNYAYPPLFGILTFIGFFIGFGVKLPVVPLHTWLPDAHVDAPTPISMILAGILLKMGGYGLIRMNLQILPDIFQYLAPMLVILGIVNIIYGGIIAFAQADLKKLIAYSSISHMGIVLLGLGALNTAGVTGSVFQLVAHGVISAGLFMIVGVIYLRTKTRCLEELGGLGQVTPRTMFFSMIITLASLGLPLLIGFAAEALVFYGAFISDSISFIKILTVIGIFGIVLSAGYILWMFQRVFFKNILPEFNKVQDITPHEVFVCMSLVFVIFFFGVYPTGLTSLFESTVQNLLKII